MTTTATKTRVLGLHPGQRPIYDSPARFKVVAAGRRWGKTELSLLKLLTGGRDGRGALTEPGLYRYVAPTQKLARRTLWRRKLKRAIDPTWLAKPLNETNLEATFVNGSIVEVMGAEEVGGLRGDGVTGVVLDEYAEMRPDAWSEEVRPSLGDTRGWALFIGTPQSHNHFYDLYVRGQDPKFPQWASWQHPSLDNPLLDLEEVEEARRTTDPRTFRQEWEASFEAIAGRAYYAFDRTHNQREVTLDPRWPICLGFDFNVNPATAVIWQRVADEARVWREVWVEHAGGEATRASAQAARDLLRQVGWRGAIRIYGDPAGKSAKTTGPADHAVLREVFPEAQWRIPSAAPHVKDRMEAVNARCLTADGKRHLYVDPECRHLLADLEQVTVPMLTTESEKRKHPLLTHISDAFGYGIHEEWPPVQRGGVAMGYAAWL